MTRVERLQAVSYAYDAAMRRLDDEPELPHFRYDCMRAIIGAAALLDRDPVALARLLADGRLADYIIAGEGTIPLPLDETGSVDICMERLLGEAADSVERERDKLEQKIRRVLDAFREASTDLRYRARQGGWRDTWRNTRSTFRLTEQWRRMAVPSDAPTGAAAEDE